MSKQFTILYDQMRTEKEFGAILETYRMQRLERNPHPMLVTGLSEGAKDVFYAAMTAELRKLSPDRPVLCIPSDEKELLKLQNDLQEAGLSTVVYPLRDFIFHNITASHEFEHERIAALCAILSNTCDAVLAVPDAALQYTIPKETLLHHTLTISASGEYTLNSLLDALTSAGYVRCELVDGVGEFAVRGGILDVFPAQNENPVRIEFFGDEIDQMGIFDALTQRKIEQTDVCFLPPAKEVLLSPEKKKSLRTLIAKQCSVCKTEDGVRALEAELEVLDGGVEPSFLDKYITYLYPEKQCLLDYFMDDETHRITSPVLVLDTAKIAERLSSSEWHIRQAITTLLEANTIAAKYAEYTKWQSDFDYAIKQAPTLLCDSFASSSVGKLSGIFTFRSKQLISYAESCETLCEDVRGYIAGGYRLLLLSENPFSAKNLRDSLFDDGITTSLSEAHDFPLTDLVPGVPVIVCGMDAVGYELPESRFAVLSTFPTHTAYAKAIAGRAKKNKKKKSAAERILSYADLTVGDYVVHVNHGIGQYRGIQTITGIDGTSHDYVKIQYAGEDALFLPCEQLDMISKYIGARGEDGIVKLSKMGGTEWTKTKARVKAAAKNMAKELIALYAARLRKPGYAFAADDDMQRTFESLFPYEETDSQENAIAEIKADMQRAVPMDRLLCGDVGYGKTEVALRAAMKAIECGKQVAILVPTTILAMQHYQTILSRFRGLPVHAEILSRFRTPKQQEEIIRRLRRGEIDIIVGTHRLVSKDVAFRDLGLVIIDEEQRFGVAAKEKLKALTENVDCLMLSATPIPRTLNMAMSGIRDMSVLDEAPGDRVPVQSYVLEYDEQILGEALKKELRRGGQIFWLHNRVEDIDACAARVSGIAPDASVAIAHGKMDKEEISAIWQQLLNGDVDILVSTTIIETGIDIPNANTLVIEHADRMGLSQLHQIRGRIGRSSRRAYAYFTYPKGKTLTEIASKRLQAIREYTEFGSGFKIAMRDLEIRGAGNLLGSEQHGHMESVGYDLYIKLLNEAILEERGEHITPKTESVIDISLDAYLPEKYVKSAAQRIDLYKKIAAVETEEDKRDILDELTDRFGTPPKAAQNLVAISYLRAMASAQHIARIEARQQSILLFPVVFDGAAWAACAEMLTADALPKETVQGNTARSTQTTHTAQSPNRRVPTAAAQTAQPQKYATPMARAAAMAKAGNAAANAAAGGKGTIGNGKSSAVGGPAMLPIRLTLSAGQKPCIQARLPRGMSLLSGIEQILCTYEAASAGKE